MTKAEILEFVDELKRLYPFDFKGDIYSEWYEAFKEVNGSCVWNALNTHQKYPITKGAPTIREIFESATKYRGMPDLIFKAVESRKRV